MSRTDKTRPGWVRVADAPGVTCVDVHDHRFGRCTLPEGITAEGVSLCFRRGCYWGGTAYFLNGLDPSDGCRECTGYHYRRAERRRSRHQIRRELRGWRGED
jgi:hypothetical protein